MSVIDRSGRLAAVPAAAVLADQHDLGRLEAEPARDRVHRLHGALRRQVDVQHAVLPVRKARQALEALMAGVRRHERFVEHQRRLLEACLDIAVRPRRIGGLAHRHPAFIRFSELLRSPFQILDLRKRRRLTRRRCGAHPDVAFDPRGLRTGAQRLEGINVEREHFPPDLDLLNRFDRRLLVNGRDGEHRLSLVQRLGCERALAVGIGFKDLAHVVDLILRTRRVFRQQDRLDAGNRHRGAGVDAPDPRVRVGAQQQPREQHARRAEIFRIPGAAGDFGANVRRFVVLPDELCSSHLRPPGKEERYNQMPKTGS